MGAVWPTSRVARLLIIGTLLTSVGTGLTLPFLYIYLHDVRGIDPGVVGAIVGWMGLLSLTFSGIWGAAMDRYGVRPVLLPLQLMVAVGAASWWWVHDPWQGFVSASLIGVAGAASFPGYQTLLASAVPRAERQAVFGLSFATVNLGIGLGGLVSGFLADIHHPDSFRLLYLIDGLSYLMPFLILIAFLPGVGGPVPAQPRTDDGPGGYREVFANRAFRRLFGFALLLMTFGYAQATIGMPAFATSVAHVSTRVVAWSLVVNAVVIVAGQLVMTRWLHGRSRSRALAVAALVIALSWAVLGVGALVRDVSPILPVAGCLLSMAVFAVAETMFSPLLPAFINALATDDLRARYNSLGSVVWGVTSIVGPLTAAPLIGHGLAGLWIVLLIGGSGLAAAVGLSVRPLVTREQDGVDIEAAAVAAPPV